MRLDESPRKSILKFAQQGDREACEPIILSLLRGGHRMELLNILSEALDEMRIQSLWLEAHRVRTLILTGRLARATEILSHLPSSGALAIEKARLELFSRQYESCLRLLDQAEELVVCDRDACEVEYLRAFALLNCDRYEAAGEKFFRASVRAAKLGDPYLEGMALANYGHSLYWALNWDRAKELLQETAQLPQRLEFPLIGATFDQLELKLMFWDATLSSKQVIGFGSTLFDQLIHLGAKRDALSVLFGLAKFALRRGTRLEFRRFADEALELARQIGNQSVQASVSRIKGIYLGEGDNPLGLWVWGKQKWDAGYWTEMVNEIPNLKGVEKLEEILLCAELALVTQDFSTQKQLIKYLGDLSKEGSPGFGRFVSSVLKVQEKLLARKILQGSESHYALPLTQGISLSALSSTRQWHLPALWNRPLRNFEVFLKFDSASGVWTLNEQNWLDTHHRLSHLLLVALIKANRTPLSKAQILFEVWGQTASQMSDSEIHKVHALVDRMRSQQPLDVTLIENVEGSYRLSSQCLYSPETLDVAATGIELNERQRKIQSTYVVGSQFSLGEYQGLTGASRASAYRDLRDLVKKQVIREIERGYQLLPFDLYNKRMA